MHINYFLNTKHRRPLSNDGLLLHPCGLNIVLLCYIQDQRIVSPIMGPDEEPRPIKWFVLCAGTFGEQYIEQTN